MAQQGLVDQPLIDMDHFLQGHLEILLMPLDHQGDLGADEAGEYKRIGFQLGRIQERHKNLIFYLQKMDALVHGQIDKIVADDDVQQVFFFLPERQVSGDDILQGGIFRQSGGQMQNAGVELPADKAAETAVLIGKVIIEGFPGNTQLMTQI